MIKRLTESAVVKAIAAFLLFEVLTEIYTHVRDALHIERVTNLQWLGNELVLVIIAVAVAVIFRTVSKLKDSIKGFWKSILCGSWFLLFCLAGTVSSILTYTSEGPGLKSPLELVIFAIREYANSVFPIPDWAPITINSPEPLLCDSGLSFIIPFKS